VAHRREAAGHLLAKLAQALGAAARAGAGGQLVPLLATWQLLRLLFGASFLAALTAEVRPGCGRRCSLSRPWWRLYEASLTIPQ